MVKSPDGRVEVKIDHAPTECVLVNNSIVFEVVSFDPLKINIQ
jgi:hypothetical protein